MVIEENPSFEDAVIDWPGTKAYASFEVENGIYLNLKGREPYGIIEKKDYERIRTELQKRLEKIGVRIKAIKKEDYFSGSYVEHFPDLYVHIKERGYKINSSINMSGVFSKVDHSKIESPFGRHHKDGVFFAFGDGINKSSLKRRFQQVDVLPTILHMIGIPTPSDVDGRVLMEIFSKNSKYSNRKVKIVSHEKMKVANIFNSIKI